MKSMDLNARFATDMVSPASATVACAMPSMMICPPCFVEHGAASVAAVTGHSSMVVMYQVAYEAARRSVQREAAVRGLSEPSMN